MTSRNSKRTRGTIAFDFDGELHEDPHYRWPPAALDFSLIEQAHDRGYAVAVMTCNDIWRVAGLLQRHGFRVYADHAMRHMYWHDPSVVLVTGRKVCATAYVDDRAIRYRFGEDTGKVWAELDSRGNIPV